MQAKLDDLGQDDNELDLELGQRVQGGGGGKKKDKEKFLNPMSSEDAEAEEIPLPEASAAASSR